MQYTLYVDSINSTNNHWKYDTKGSSSMEIFIRSTGIDILLIHQKGPAGLLHSSLSSKQDVRNFINLVSGPIFKGYKHPTGFAISYKNIVETQEDNVNLNGMETTTTKDFLLEGTHEFYNTIEPLLKIFSECNIAKTIVDSGLLQLLPGGDKRVS